MARHNPHLYTVGVYGFTAEAFFDALRHAKIDIFCDLRARRGVRGHEYAFANSERLQAKLRDLGIRYLHFPDLAPNEEIRKAQYAVDESRHIGKRQRTELSPAFVTEYKRLRLNGFDSDAFVESLGPEAQRAVLFCVEREPAACHRSLVAERLRDDLGLPITHLFP